MSALGFLNDQATLLALLLLLVVVLAVLALVVRAAMRVPGGGAATARKLTPRAQTESLRSSFRRAVELVEEHIADRSLRYTLPWVLVLDEAEEQATLPLAQCGIVSVLGSDATASAAVPGLDWHFFDKGVVLDIQASYLGQAEEADVGREPGWEELLTLCRDYRPERPFDALMVTIPAALLADPHPDARQALVRLARRANRRLWLAQNRFAMRFGVYLTISGCERLPGFSAYARALPEQQRGDMLGWSSPYDVNTLYRTEWADEIIRQTVRTLSDSSAELFALAAGVDSSANGAADYFLLSSRVQALHPQLQLYLGELMRPSNYHEPFLLRGVYFCGDAGEAAAVAARRLQADAPGAGAAAGRGDPADTDGSDHGAAGDPGDPGDPGDAATALPDDAALPGAAAAAATAATLRRPVFLRDLFEHKVFAEIGLTRPSGTQHLSRPLLHRGLRWAAWGVAGVWCTGLAVNAVLLTQQCAGLQTLLARVRIDTDTRLRAVQQGERPSPEVEHQRTLAMLHMLGQMDDRRLWSVFMPGSWPVVDSLSWQLRTRVEQAFGEVAVHSLRQGLYDRTMRLSGVPGDPATGVPIEGAPCQPAPASDTSEDATLGFENVQPFVRWLEYINEVDRIDQASQALERLQNPDLPPDDRDLALLVRTVLGLELPGLSTHAAQLFQAPAARQGGLAVPAMQAALRCGLRQVQQPLHQRVFDDNDLLATLRELDSRIAALAAASPIDVNEDSLAAWRDLHGLLKDTDSLLARPGGAWMHKPTLQPGPTWERALARIAAVRLLGPDSARLARLDAEAGHARFSRELADVTSRSGALGIQWNDKDKRWLATPELTALRGALQELFAQSWIQKSGERYLPYNASTALVGWDLLRLDHALAVAEQRKRFRAELLVRFPVELRGAVERLANQQFAGQVVDLLGQAMIPGGRTLASDSAAADAERARLVRVQALLRELGAHAAADQMQVLGQRDAMARLRQLDDALERADLYAPIGRSWASWRGEKAPTLVAFGLADAGALAGYLGQQRGRVETLAREAELLLGTPGTGALAGSSGERWLAITRDLERYRLKSPGSSLLMLENFLVALAGDVDAASCTDRLARLGALPRGADFFAQRQQQLVQALGERCSELRGRDQREQWSQFTSLFNRMAAGRPPFAGTGWSADSAPIENDELVNLLASFERAQRSLRDSGSGGGGGGAGGDTRQPAAAARRFLDQFERVRTFLQPLVPPDEATPAGYDIAVEFRANPQAEIEGQNIIDWSIEVGGQRLGWRDPPRALRWEPGQPVSLNWRLAKDGPAQPRLDERQPALRVEQRAVSLRYADHWALLNLIARHRDSDAAARPDGRSQTLKVEFPLTIQPASPGGDSTDTRARLYLRLTLSPAGKRAPLAWPGSFPVRAPDSLLP